jgi:predicted ArsR family transcriptional regulator
MGRFDEPIRRRLDRPLNVLLTAEQYALLGDLADALGLPSRAAVVRRALSAYLEKDLVRRRFAAHMRARNGRR